MTLIASQGKPPVNRRSRGRRFKLNRNFLTPPGRKLRSTLVNRMFLLTTGLIVLAAICSTPIIFGQGVQIEKAPGSDQAAKPASPGGTPPQAEPRGTPTPAE